MDFETRWYTSPNITLPRPVLPSNLSMTGQNLQIAHDVGGGISKLSDFAGSSMDDLVVIGSSKSMLLDSGAFAVEDGGQPQLPTIVRAAAVGLLRNDVSPLGSCGSTPESVRNAVEKFEAIYVDEECRCDEEPVADTGIGEGTGAVIDAEGDQAMGIQERFLPALARGQGTEPASQVTLKQSRGRASLQELNINSLQPLGLANSSTLRVVAPEVDGDQATRIAKALHAEDHQKNVSNKENIEPSEEPSGSRSDVAMGKMSRAGGTRDDSAHNQLRPPGLSQLQWLRLLYGSR